MANETIFIRVYHLPTNRDATINNYIIHLKFFLTPHISVRKTYDKLDQYYEKFGDVFPTMRFKLSSADMIKLMDKCIKKNKSINEIDPPLKDVMY